MSRKRVVITGLGMVTPLGLTVASTWDGVVAGKSGITFIDEPDFPVASRIAGFVKDFDPTLYLPAKEAKRVGFFIQYAIAAATQALADAKFEVAAAHAHRVGICIGSGIGGIHNIEQQHTVLLEKGPRKVSPFFVTGTIANMAAGNVSIKFGIKGPSLCLSTACATGAHSIGLAARLINTGDADVMLAGGSEHGATVLGMAGFAAARALSTRNDDPQGASRPWDKDRDGFVIADGSGVIVLEEREHALRRNAPIYAELVGFGMSSDAYHITAPSADGEGGAIAISNALSDANLDPEQVQYINAHATSTPTGDISEVRAIRKVFGRHADRLLVSASKSMLGHLLGAAGSVEAIITILALKHQMVPPTINLTNPDAECDLDFVPGVARSCPLDIAVSNSFAFGGSNGCLIFKSHE